MRRLRSIALIAFAVQVGLAQKSPILLDDEQYEFVERLRILDTAKSQVLFPVYPQGRHEIHSLLEAQGGVQAERFRAKNNDVLESKKSVKPVAKHFYQSPAIFYEVNRPALKLRVNPILHFAMGSSDRSDDPLWLNQRGIEIRAAIDDRFYLQTRVLETQAGLPGYIRDYVDAYEAIPGQGLYKPFSSSLFGVDQGYDYLNGDGQLGIALSEHVDISIGHGKHFIGSGMRSLLLSDFADNYTYLRLNTQVWKLRYTNIYAELTADSPLASRGFGLLPKKYMTAHHLGFQIGSDLYLGLFESVVFSRNNQFEFQYLNPIILYRIIEQKLGSPDNVLLGLDMRIDLLPRTSWYGQIVFDELQVSRLFDGSQWWGNKFATQMGVKHMDLLGVSNLDVQIEWNRARPFIYSHIDSSATYTHAAQELAHPLGAHFDELLFRLTYRPMASVRLQLYQLQARVAGTNAEDNVGSDPRLSNVSRYSEFGVGFFDLGHERLSITRLTASYEWKPGLYVETEIQHRQRDELSEFLWSLGLRWNMTQRIQLF